MKHDVFSDTWVATDALGRELPGHAECGDPRPDRFVGIFYFICNNYTGPNPPHDVTKTIAANPSNPAFIPNTSYYWGEPEMGYYRSADPWVLRRHAYMLADAGVDTLIFDTTNNKSFPETYLPLFETFRQIRGEGEKTPDVCFLASEKSILQTWDVIYSKGLYSDLWFQWKGKPLLLFGQWEEVFGKMDDNILPQEIRDFFTIRHSWAWDSLRWYGDSGYHNWPWVAHYPQCVGWDQEGVAENVPVAIGQHPLSGIGRSFHNGKEPEVNEYDTTEFTAEGLHFAEQWQHALKVDPEFIFVTGWNEWNAGSVLCDDTSQEGLQARWSFFPGAVLGKATRPLKIGDIYFIDQYNQEFSRDAEPMRGGHTDSYYYQLAANVRRYKGVRKPAAASPARSIDINGSFYQWNDVQPEYRDHLYETLHRKHPGFGSFGEYVNETGRNEFTHLKVAQDDANIYFYARTRASVTPHTDPNWMLLFINSDQSKATGWEGYDYLINLEVLDGGRTTVKRCTGGWSWETAGEAQYRVEGNQIMIAVPRELLGMQGKAAAFDFKWADNIQGSGEIEDFFLNGDTAPSRRFDYRYQE